MIKKWFIIGLIDKHYCKKQKTDIIRMVIKKAAEYYIANKDVLKETWAETCQKKKKKQKENTTK